MYYITNIYALKTLADDISNTTTDVRDVIDKLHDIARGRTPRANTRDRIAATRILLDRGFGKVPRRADYNPDRHQTPVPDDDGPVGPSHSPTPTTPGTVAQLDESLHDSSAPLHPSSRTRRHHSSRTHSPPRTATSSTSSTPRTTSSWSPTTVTLW